MLNLEHVVGPSKLLPSSMGSGAILAPTANLQIFNVQRSRQLFFSCHPSDSSSTLIFENKCTTRFTAPPGGDGWWFRQTTAQKKKKKKNSLTPRQP